MNYFRTALLLAALTGFFLVAGYLLGGQTGLILALVAALGMNVFAYWNSDKMVLRMSNAQEIGPNDAPELYGIVADLAQRGGLPMPRVYIIDEEQPNAFATGRNPENAAVAAMVMISVSRWRTWLNSCAITPVISSRLKWRSRPVVAATAAFSGLRPVAKALGCSSSMM